MKYFVIILLPLLFFCCTEESTYRIQLDEIENSLQSDPTTASEHLDSLYATHPDAFIQGDLQAKYALLKTYCLYKQYVNEKDDSLISIAENYYLQQGTDYEKALSLFLHGCILCNNEDYYASMKKFKQAADIGQSTGDHYLLGQIYTNQYRLCTDAYDANQVLYAQKALTEYQLFGNKLYIQDGEINVGLAYFAKQQYNTCALHLEKALQMAQERQDTFAICKCIRQIAYMEVEKGNPTEAYRYFGDLFHQYGAKPLVHDLAYMAYVYALFNQPDSALDYLQQIRSTGLRRNSSRLYYLQFSSLVYRQMRQYEKAYELGEAYHALKDSIVWHRLSQSVMKEDYDYVSTQLEISQDKAALMRWIVTLVTTMLTIAALWFYFYKRSRREAERHMNEKLRLSREKEELLKSELQAKQEQQRLLQEKIQMQAEAKQQAYQFLKQSESVYRFQLALVGKHTIVADDWRNLNNIFNEMLPSFLQTLDPENNLNDIELKTCLLLKVGFKPSEIASLTNHALGSISSVNNRLCKKKLSTDGGAKEWLEYIRSI